MKSIKIIAIASFFTTSLQAHVDEELAANLLAQLQAPQDVIVTTSKWISDNPDIINAALGYEALINSVKPFHDAVNELLKQKGLKNLSNFNYVFELPNTNYIIKIAGHANRKHNLNTLSYYLRFPQNPFDPAHYQYGRALTVQDYALFAQELPETDFDHVVFEDTILTVSSAPKTYQTISRGVNYLAFMHAKEQHQLDHLFAPETYLVHIPGRPTELSDRNYLIVEKKLENLQRIQDISEQQGKEIDIAVKEANLFDYSKENMFAGPYDTIACVDFEQPNNANPQQFNQKTVDLFKKMGK